MYRLRKIQSVKRSICLKNLILFCCCLLSFLSLSSHAESTQSHPSDAIAVRDALLMDLTNASLKKSMPILEKIEQISSEEMLPVFTTLLEGGLYYVKSDRSLVQKRSIDGKTSFTTFPFLNKATNQQASELTSKKVKKIKVNNALRKYLRGAIARIQLSSTDISKRQSSVRSLLSSLDESTISRIHQLREKETDTGVKAMMDIALDLYSAENGSEREQVAAIRRLANSLENEVRNALTQLTKDDQPEVVRNAALTALKTIDQQVNRYALVDQLFFGLSLGSVLLLASIGLAITFGVMGVINMAHGEMIMLGAYTTYVVQLLMPNHIDYSIWVAIPAAFVVSGLMGVIIERGVIRHLHGRPLETLLATFGISLILQQLVRSIFSPLNRQVSTPSWMSGSVEINPVLSLTLNRLYILAFALLVFFALLFILKKTSLGLNVRAVSQNRNMARAMGVKTAWVDAMTFGLGSGIAGIAGVALSQLTNVGPNLGQAYIIDSFMVVVFGGVGNLFGTLVAAFSLGIATKFLEPVTGAVLAAIAVLVFIILFIQKRPKGLFPQKGRAAE
ncbi:urea ABC transporter permease subunit UrtB [Marinomonas sp. 15G1-11]|mgnify:CR=1 FL=1|uniref:Urea ABC transporter permease subunit UrtB n=1 Tax=Marinomonas phaeophyticola TaxID=3004091 RepID=A0ABT4JTL3_9GAMM|nr:urea ABC transporter permease subunit UrtB [Marinomonas sp. 15G1-11]MCZ2721367.1 urea ABC transporter permease subunit UrtB [Marinomonas sp. 15G1-11]